MKVIYIPFIFMLIACKTPPNRNQSSQVAEGYLYISCVRSNDAVWLYSIVDVLQRTGSFKANDVVNLPPIQLSNIGAIESANLGTLTLNVRRINTDEKITILGQLEGNFQDQYTTQTPVGLVDIPLLEHPVSVEVVRSGETLETMAEDSMFMNRIRLVTTLGGRCIPLVFFPKAGG